VGRFKVRSASLVKVLSDGKIQGAPAPKKPSLSHFHYGNSTERGAAGQVVTSLDSSGSVRLRTGILRV